MEFMCIKMLDRRPRERHAAGIDAPRRSRPAAAIAAVMAVILLAPAFGAECCAGCSEVGAVGDCCEGMGQGHGGHDRGAHATHAGTPTSEPAHRRHRRDGEGDHPDPATRLATDCCHSITTEGLPVAEAGERQVTSTSTHDLWVAGGSWAPAQSSGDQEAAAGQLRLLHPPPRVLFLLHSSLLR